MARHESEREDLIREATALRERVELIVSGEAEPVVAGFHADGRLSIYFGGDPVYHFDAAGRLRRAFVEGVLYRSQGTTLARLERVRQENSIELLRRDLEIGELKQFFLSMRCRVEALQNALQRGEARVERQVPSDVLFKPRLLAALPDLRQGLLSPHLGK